MMQSFDKFAGSSGGPLESPGLWVTLCQHPKKPGYINSFDWLLLKADPGRVKQHRFKSAGITRVSRWISRTISRAISRTISRKISRHLSTVNIRDLLMCFWWRSKSLEIPSKKNTNPINLKGNWKRQAISGREINFVFHLKMLAFEI